MSSDQVIIIGGGAAGMTAALTVAARGAKAVLVTKAIGGGSSPWAQGGVAVSLGADDSPEQHLADTIACGGGLVDETAARVLVSEAAARIDGLLAIGVPFDRRPDGQITLGLEGGHHRRRIIHAGGGATGWHIVQSLAAKVQDAPNITIVDNVTVTELLAGPSGVTGVRLADAAAGGVPANRPETLLGPVVLATGGAAGLFGRSTNPGQVNGAGIALAWRAGAAVADMEFVQFHPTALNLPVPTLGGRALLLTEALRGEGAHLLDHTGQRFMAEGPLAQPLAELAPRDIVARAIYRKLLDGPVYLSLRHLDAGAIRAHFPNLVEMLLPVGLDLARDLLPVAPAAHYLMGGVWSDVHGATTVPNLFVAGEVACTGVQGSNRLASNSLLECLVFGRRAGLAALEGYRRENLAMLQEEAVNLPYEAPIPAAGTPAPSDLGSLLDSHLGVERDGRGIAEALAALPEEGSSLVARRMALGAWYRRESRGAHYRTDFPATDPAWQGRLVQRQGAVPQFVSMEALARVAAGFAEAS